MATAATIPATLVHSYAAPFIVFQGQDGAYMLPPAIQRHQKAEIAMALAGEATGIRAYAESARRDLDWVIETHLEPNGGLNWNGPWEDIFFEVHQHWFLISSELIRRQVETPETLQPVQRAVWRFLTRTNQASADFYEHNQANYGPFFGYRSVNRLGEFMTQAPFKGSYEIGAALWSLALHVNSDWLGADPNDPTENNPQSYLERMVPQIAHRPDSLGYFDREEGLWVRSMTWTGAGWEGFTPHDWKYALHMDEGAMLNELMTGDPRLGSMNRKEILNLLSKVQDSGEIATLPDEFGSSEYEYGEALSVLGLGVLLYQDDPPLSIRCLEAGQLVADFVASRFPPASSEDCAMILAGLSRVYMAQKTHPAAGVQDLAFAAADLSLRVWPNPSTERISIAYNLDPGRPGRLLLLDPAGRRVAAIPLPQNVQNNGTLIWSGSGSPRRDLPSGRYTAILESGGRRARTSITILR